MINETRKAIADLLTAGFLADEKKPFITTKGFPKDAEALEKMQKEFRTYDNCALAITFSSENFGPKRAVIYPNRYEFYRIYIFSNSKKSDEEIIEYYELTRDILYTKFYLYAGEVNPVQSEKTGLYIAAIDIGLHNIYQGES